jgi:hypothetical protein
VEAGPDLGSGWLNRLSNLLTRFVLEPMLYNFFVRNLRNFEVI